MEGAGGCTLGASPWLRNSTDPDSHRLLIGQFTRRNHARSALGESSREPFLLTQGQGLPNPGSTPHPLQVALVQSIPDPPVHHRGRLLDSILDPPCRNRLRLPVTPGPLETRRPAPDTQQTHGWFALVSAQCPSTTQFLGAYSQRLRHVLRRCTTPVSHWMRHVWHPCTSHWVLRRLTCARTQLTSW